MNALALLLVPVLLAGGGESLESSGNFVMAGVAYEEDNDIAGQARILSRFIEESLYAGEASHAFQLLQFLESYPLEPGYLDFWYARLSWTMGLAGQACDMLEDLEAGPWLSSRAAGIAEQYGDSPEDAMVHHLIAWELASSSRERFYTALDIAFTHLQSGDYYEAERFSTALAVVFPGDGLPVISLAMALEGQGRYGTAMTLLQDLSSDTTKTGITRSMASALLEEMI